MAGGDGRELVVAAQAALLDDPAFLRGLVQEALQAILEAEMEAHLGVVTLMEMYVQGVSTRKVAAITEQLCSTSFSKSQVSALTGTRDATLAAWREWPLAVSFPYLSVDARYEHVARRPTRRCSGA